MIDSVEISTVASPPSTVGSPTYRIAVKTSDARAIAHNKSVATTSSPTSSSGQLRVSVTRSHDDVDALLASLNREFPSILLPILPARETTRTSLLLPNEQLCMWVKWLLYFLDTVDDVRYSTLFLNFVLNAAPFDAHQQPAEGESGTESDDTVRKLVAASNRLKTVMQGEKNYALKKETTSHSDDVEWMQRLTAKLRALSTSIDGSVGLVEKTLGDRFKHKRESAATRDINHAVAVASKSGSGSSLKVGDRVVSVNPGQSSGTVMYIGYGNSPQDKLVGVCWDDPNQGNCNGSWNGIKHFHCGPNQGSFESVTAVHSDISEGDPSIRGLNRLSMDLEDVHKASIDTALTHGSLAVGTLTLYSCVLRSVGVWVDRLIAIHYTVASAEAWLDAQANQKSNSVEKELEAADLVGEINSIWQLVFKRIQLIWEGFGRARALLVRESGESLAEMLCTLDQFNLQIAAPVVESREEVSALFYQNSI